MLYRNGKNERINKWDLKINISLFVAFFFIIVLKKIEQSIYFPLSCSRLNNKIL